MYFLPRIGIHGEEEGAFIYPFRSDRLGDTPIGDNHEHMIDLELEATVTWIDQWQITIVDQLACQIG